VINLIYLLLCFASATPTWAGGIDWHSNLCAGQKKFLEEGIKNRVSFKELGEKIQKISPKIIFLGEFHTDDTALSYPSLLKSFKAGLPALDCLAFEADPKNNPDGLKRDPWRKLAELAKKNYNMESHLVDGACTGQDGWSEENTKGNEFMKINTRNHCMAGNLAALLEGEKCHQILMINGAIHLQENYLDGRPGIPARLRDAGIPVFSAFALDLSRGNSKARQSSLDAWIWPQGPKPGKSWNDLGVMDALCTDVPGANGENYAFLTGGMNLASKVPITHVNSPEGGNSGAWDQFDALIMLSCPGFAGDRCGENSGSLK
jgi:hypothetical protein